MLAVRHFPHLDSPALWGRLRRWAVYDADGRASAWLHSGAEPLGPELAGIALAVCPEVPAPDWCGVLVQCYEGGAATTPCHSDRGSTGRGFILSLGAPRTLRTHRVPGGAAGCGDYGLDVTLIECVGGTAVVTDEEFHRHHHHQVVADPGAGERLSLVFRTKPTG